MAAFTLAISGKVADWQSCRVIRQWSEPAQTIGIQKCLALINDLLVLLVPRAELFHPSIKTMLNGVTARLFTPASDRCSRYQSYFKDCKALGYAVYLLAIINRNETSPARLRIASCWWVASQRCSKS
ncbi:hypothetical protein SB00094_02461 [Klebsiella variicola subsp. tropica]|nr:hypothetical protein SB00094_02461 [Klebsiella variicola subsp. tropica]VGQ04602.1 hypothetical protein SB5544_04110 [Klebsiella variicola]